jgi:hypothetical protein
MIAKKRNSNFLLEQIYYRSWIEEEGVIDLEMKRMNALFFEEIFFEEGTCRFQTLIHFLSCPYRLSKKVDAVYWGC